ncbi:DNA-directed DNA polymerase alpha catalytic subunit pol1 [Dimargaris cristalligena]|nr:DNA-directed DNA polymerase alpha catalytic subunit pol1 [Dimargaris cristalligena]
MADSSPSKLRLSRRVPKGSSRSDKLASLRKARETGEYPQQHYEDQPEGDIFVDIEDNDYHTIMHNRLHDDFVVDDEGLGYAETGLDDFGNESNSDSECPGGPSSGKGAGSARQSKRGRPKQSPSSKQGPFKKAREATHKPPAEKSNPILKAFAKRGREGAPSAWSTAATGTTGGSTADQNADLFMASIFGELDEEVEDLPTKRHSTIPVATLPVTQARTTHQRSYEGRLQELRDTEMPASPVRVKREPVDDMPFEISVNAPDKTDIRATQPLTDSVVIKEEESLAACGPDFDDDFMDSDDDEELISQMDAITSNIVSSDDHPIKNELQTPTVTRMARAAPTLDDLTDKIELTSDFNLPQFGLNLAAKLENGESGVQSNPGDRELLASDGLLALFWIDAYEKDGVVYLFGKVRHPSSGRYLSCCVSVQNIERNLFVLPREKLLDADGQPTDEDVTMHQVFQEVEQAMQKQRITKRRFKEVTRKYAFEIPEIPAEAGYLKVLYSFQQPSFEGPTAGKSYSHIFGTNTSALELFLTKRKIMGPCWLQLRNAQVQHRNLSWCRVEATVANPKDITPFSDTDANRPTDAAPLTVMTINLKTVLNPKKTGNEIIAAHLLVNHQVHPDNPGDIQSYPSEQYTAVRPLTDSYFPVGLSNYLQSQKMTVECSRNEHGLLSFITSLLQRVDPDIIVGHNFLGHDLNLLLARMKELKTDGWSRLGRLRRTQWPRSFSGRTGYSEQMIMSGRVPCDTYLAAKDMISSKSYSLTQLALSELHIQREEIEFSKIPAYYSTAKNLHTFLRHCQFDAYLVARLMYHIQALPLTKQLTNLAGNLWSRTIKGARAERNEYLLLHEFRRCKFICPDKDFGAKGWNKNAARGPSGANSRNSNPTAVPVAIAGDQVDQEQHLIEEGLAPTSNPTGRRKPAYAGGLVLEPKRGYYDRFVLLLDFNSLYPSIIQEFNICFTTVDRHHSALPNQADVDAVPELPDPYLAPGVLPRVLKTLVERRRQVKNLMKDKSITPIQTAQYDIRQRALKLTANSMYGCLGFAQSRFYAKPLAMLITHKGREILQSTVDLAKTDNLNVIYGDTDSIMIHTNTRDLNQVMQIGRDFKKKANERYHLLELEIDGVFQRMLLLKKKKYAALKVTELPSAGASSSQPSFRTDLEIKGMDQVRRDWSDLSHDVSNFVLAQILSGDEHDDILSRIHGHLQEVGDNVRLGRIVIDKYVVNKGLNKNPEDYNDAKSQPHVQVALRMKRKGETIGSGDTVPYVIVSQESHLAYLGHETKPLDSDSKTAGPSGNASSQGYAERAYHPRDVTASNGVLQIDGDWYLNHQVHPPIMRMCEPIEGTDAARLAGFLGLDSSKFHSGGGGGSGGHGAGGSGTSPSEEGLRPLDSLISDEERFSHADRWQVRCRTCRNTFEFPGIAHPATLDATSVAQILQVGFQCPQAECGHRVPFESLVTQLTMAIRRHIQRYNQFYMVCDDPMDASQHRTRQMSVYGKRCLHSGCRGRMNDELKYYESLFKLDKAEFKASDDNHVSQIRGFYYSNSGVFEGLLQVTTEYLNLSARRFVDLDELFKDIRRHTMPNVQTITQVDTKGSLGQNTVAKFKRNRVTDSSLDNVARVFQPFRSIGLITTDVPVVVYIKSRAPRIMASLGTSFQVYLQKNMSTEGCSTALEHPITSMTGTDFTTFVTSGNQVVKFQKYREQARTLVPAGARGHTHPNTYLFNVMLLGSQVMALSVGGSLPIWNHGTLEEFTTLDFDTRTFHPTFMMHPTTYLNKIVLGSKQGSLQIWNIKTRRMVYEIASMGAAVTRIEQAPAVDVVAVGLADGSIIIHNLRLDKRIVRFQQNGRVTSIAFRTDEGHHHMVTGDENGNITVWDLANKRLFYQLDRAHGSAVSSLYFMPGEPLLISNSGDNSIKTWVFDKVDSTPRLMIELAGNERPPTNIQFYGASSTHLLTTGPDRALRLFVTNRAVMAQELSQTKSQKGASQSGRLPPIVQMASSSVRELDWSNVVTCHQNMLGARLWSTHLSRLEPMVLRPKAASQVKAVTMSHCGNFALLGQENGTVSQFNVQSGILRREFKAHTAAVTGIACDNRNRQIVSASLDGQVAFWNMTTGELNHITSCGAAIAKVVYHYENGLVVAICDDYTIRVLDTETYRVVRKIDCDRLRIFDAAISPDGRWVVAALQDSTLRTWDLPTGHMIDWFRVSEMPTSVTFSPLGDLLATTHVDQKGVSIWLNKAMFRFVPLRPVSETEPRRMDLPSMVVAPGASSKKAAPARRGAKGKDDSSITALTESMDNLGDLVIVEYETPAQLAETMISLSALPRSRWQTLLHLDVIKKRNKPVAPPKKPENAPFFLQAQTGANPLYLQATAETESKTEGEANADNSGSKILNLGMAQPDTPFSKELMNCEAQGGDFTPFMAYMKTLGPSAVDFALRSMSLENAFREPLLFLQALEATLLQRRDFELVQAYLNVFLKIHGDIIALNPDAFLARLANLNDLLHREWQRLESMLRYSQCLIEFTRSSQR